MATKHRLTRPVSAKKKATAARPAVRRPKPIRSASAKPAPHPAKKDGRRTPAAEARRTAASPARKPVPRTQPIEVRVSPGPKPERLAPAVPVPSGPSSHDLAMEAFERGFQALQQRRFADAAAAFSSIFGGYPDEKELHERARVYLAICERQAAAKHSQEPRTLEERMNAATVALNRGAFEEAIRLLGAADSENDVVHYMLAVAHASLGDAERAIPHLRHAVELNPENRYLARQDADLQPLREDPGFVALLESAAAPPRRTTTRLRSGR